MRVRIAHHFTGVDVETFVRVYYSTAFNQQVAPLAGLASRVLLDERVNDDGTVQRRVRMRPDITLPGPVQKRLRGAPIEYDEISVYDPHTHRARYRIESAAGARVDVRGEIAFVGQDGGVTREINGTVEVRVLGLGRIVEGLIVRETRGRYDAIHAFTQAYLDAQPRRA